MSAEAWAHDLDRHLARQEAAQREYEAQEAEWEAGVEEIRDGLRALADRLTGPEDVTEGAVTRLAALSEQLDDLHTEMES